MKTFRLCLLLLLAVLLPVRGALAVAMQCSGTGPQERAQAHQIHHGHQHHASADDRAHHQHDATAHDHADGAGHAHVGGTDKCNLCAASCSATGLVSAPMAMAEAQPVTAVFPHIHAPPPSFIPDGQERPPRSI